MVMICVLVCVCTRCWGAWVHVYFECCAQHKEEAFTHVACARALCIMLIMLNITYATCIILHVCPLHRDPQHTHTNTQIEIYACMLFERFKCIRCATKVIKMCLFNLALKRFVARIIEHTHRTLSIVLCNNAGEHNNNVV